MASQHGLTVFSGLDVDASQRLQRPVNGVVTNCFNDATSAATFKNIYTYAGHSGIDFGCGADAPVVAMYGGEVIEAKSDFGSADRGSRGNYVKIRSCTNPDNKTGFEHTYLHLNRVDVSKNDFVKKGQQIGLSGNTGQGIEDAHLHVHLTPLMSPDENGRQEPEEGSSGKKANLDGTVWELGDLLQSPVRVEGSINFLCFLEPDAGARAPVITEQSFPPDLRKMLSPRAWDAFVIPLFMGEDPPADYRSTTHYTNNEPDVTYLHYVGGSEVACYVVLEENRANAAIVWYKIRHTASADDPNDFVEGWVPSRGKIGKEPGVKENVAWVHVEAAATPALPSRATLTTNNADTNVRSSPSVSAGTRGTLVEDKQYTLRGTYYDLMSRGHWFDDPVAVQAYQRWWQIDYEGRPGWVRSDWVNECGPTGDIALGWPHAPLDLQAEIRGGAVQVSWVPDPAPENVPVLLRVTGYRIWRYRKRDTAVFAGITNTLTQDLPIHTLQHSNGRVVWTDYPQAPSLESEVVYQVAALVGGTAGPATPLASPSAAPIYWTNPAGPPLNPPVTPPVIPLPPPAEVSVWKDSMQEGRVVAVTGPGHGTAVAGVTLLPGRENARKAVGYFRGWVADPQLEWLRLRQAISGAGGDSGPRGGKGARGARGASRASGHVHGWVPLTAVEGGRGWDRQARLLPQPPFLRAPDSRQVPVRIGPSLGYTDNVTRINRDSGWFEILGKNGDWWQIQATATHKGWVQAFQVEETGDDGDVPFVNESPPPALAQPGGSDAEAEDARQASGHYLNLANSWQGSWTVSKTGTRVTAAFQSTRSPVQYLARQNPMDLLVLPEGFRPTSTRDITVRGVHVTINGVDYAGAPTQDFTLRVSTTGAVRYVNGTELDHVGFLRYKAGTPGLTPISWTTATAATPGERPELPRLTDSGTFHNQETNPDSSWEMELEGNEVEGTFTASRSPVQYYSLQRPEALIWLPRQFWPERDERFEVRNAVRVDADGNDTADTRRVDFWITVRASDGRMYYDRDTSLETQGVGYLRYEVDVDWDVAPRVRVPSEPRDLEVDDVSSDEVELDWRSPSDDGGDSVDEYKVDILRNGRWREEEDDISRTRYTVEGLAAYTRYSFRVAARNSSEDWGPYSTAVSVTTRREKPGRPRSLEAEATHDRVTLDWRAPSSGGDVTGYRVQRRVGSGRYAVVAADTGSAVSFYVDEDVQPATQYSYQVRALNHGEEGDWSSAETVTTAAAPTIPGQVRALNVEPGTNSQLSLSWTEPSDTGGGVTGYQVERSPDATPKAWTVVEADTGSDAATWDEREELAADRDYHYRVSACNSAGVGMASDEGTGRTRPRVRLDQPVRYPLTARAEPRGDAAATATFAGFLPERTYDLTGAAGTRDGWQRVLGFHAARPDALWLPAAAGSVQGTPEDLAQVPGAPVDFTASLAANNEVNLAWSAPTTGAAVTGYRLWRQVGDGAFAQLGSDLAATATDYTDSTVTVGQAYRYRLQALSGEGAGIPSETRAVAVMATPAAPASVGNLQATATATSLQLSWQKAATGGLPAEYGVAWQVSTATEAESVTVAGTSHTLTDLRSDTEHTVRVTARNQEGEAAAASRTASTLDAAPGTPTAVSVAVAGNGATVTWQVPVDGGHADSYEVQHKTRADSWPSTSTTRTVLDHALTDLTFAGEYDLRVRAVNTEGSSDWVSLSFTAGPERPGAVRDLAVVPGADSQLQLSWRAPADHSVVTGHRIERAVAAETLSWSDAEADTGTADTTWSESGLDAATTYHYRVTGRSAAGLGTEPVEAEGATRPQAALKATATYPLQAYADPQTTASVTHTWDQHDATVKLDIAGRVTGTDGWYRVLRFGESTGGPYWLPAASVTVTGATTAVPEAPGLPTGLMATATHNSVTLTWTAPATGGTVTRYRIWRRIGTDAFTLLETDPESTAATHTDLGRAAATPHAYQVQAVSEAGGGPRTAAVNVTTEPTPVAPDAPTDLRVTPGSDGQLQLSWTAPAATGTHDLAGYLVERSPDTDPKTWFFLSEYTNTTDTTWTESGLEADTVYHYRVRAVSGAGGGAPSDAAEGQTRPQVSLKADATYPLRARAWPEATAPETHSWAMHDETVQLDIAGRVTGTDGWYRVLRFGESASGPYWLPAAAVTVTGAVTDVPEAPGVPGTFRSTASTHESVTLGWSAPTTGGTVTGYRLWRQEGTGTPAVLGDDLAADVLSHTDSGLAAETAYAYRLQALSEAGAGVRTATAEITTLAVPVTPGRPTALEAAPGADSQMQLTWRAPASGAAVTGYRIERSRDVMPRDWTDAVVDIAGPATTWSDSGLAATTTYHYRVTARSAAGLGTESAETSGTTRPQAALLAAVTYPVTARAWPLATATATHSWAVHDAAVKLDVAGQGAGGGAWYRVLRFGQGAAGPYWLPAASVAVTGATTDVPEAPGVPGEPAPPTATHESVTLTWTAPTTGGTVTGYRLWRQEGEEDFTVLGTDLAAAVLTHTDTTVAAATAYQYRVQALSVAGAGVRTAAVSVTTAETPRKPGAPTILAAAPGPDSQMVVSWEAPVDAGTHPITGYRIERAVDAPTLDWRDAEANTGTTDLTWSDAGLDAATVYHYRVSARNSVGTGSASDDTDGTTRPQAALLATATYPLKAHRWPAASAPTSHSWDTHDAAARLDVAGQGAGGGGWYRVLRFGQGASGPYWLPAASVTVTGATADVPQAPGVPGDFGTTDLQGRVVLGWSAPTTGGAVTGYRLWRQAGEGAWAALGAVLAADALAHTDTDVTAGTTYRYRLQAQSATGYGVRTAALDAVVAAPPAPPAGPGYFAVAQVAAGTAQLAWDPVAEATGYEVEMRQAFYAHDHAEARVEVLASGTFTLQTGATTTATVTVVRTGTRVELSGLPTGGSYNYWDFHVRAVNAGGPSAWVDTFVSSAATHRAPRHPTGLGGRRTAAGTASLHWDPVTGATDYRVYFDFPADDQGRPAGWDWLPYREVEIAVTDTTAVVSGLPATAASWGFRVTAFSGSRESVRSAALAVSTATAPAAPTALTAGPGADSQMQLGWTAPADRGSQPITGYRIERSRDTDPRAWTDAVVDITGTATTWSDSDLTGGTTYHYRVRARNDVGLGDPSEETSGTARPQAALAATASYPLTAHAWPAATAPATHSWTVHDAMVKLDIAALGPGSGVWYRVLRFGESASGPYWLPAAAVTVTGATADLPAVPAAPAPVTAAPEGESQMQLTWTAAATGGAATGYRIERSPDATPRVWTDVAADTGTTDTTWADSGLDAGTTYHYRVTGRNAAGPGVPAAASGRTRPQLTLRATATYPLTAHQWPLATAPATHTWDVHDATVTLEVLAQGAGGGGWFRVLRPGESASGPYWLPAAAVSVTGATADLPQAPGVPGDFATPAATHDTVTLTWTAPATGGTVTGYRLWRQTGEEAFAVLGSDLAADVLTHADDTVMADTAYRYRLQALSAAGAGVRNAAVAATTAETPRKPGMPTDLEAAPGTDSRMVLSWEAPTDAGTQPITGYRIERSPDETPRAWTDAEADTGTTATTWNDSGLEADTRYRYRVSARNSVGAGLPSGETDGTTRPQAALLATAAYPLKAHRWPAATAPVGHTWATHDAALKLDVVGQGPGGGGWYRVLRFGAGASGPYWLPAAAVSVTGAVTDVPEAPGVPGELRTTETQGRVVLTWNYPATGGTVTGHRLWRQAGEAAWTVLTDTLDGAAYEYADGDVAIGSTYQYRLQAQSAAGYGPRTVALGVTVTPPPPPDPAYFGAAQTGATTLDLAWDAVAEATGYEIEIRQSHGDTYVLLPDSGTFSLRTGPEAADVVTVTVAGTGTARRLTGLPAGYASWNLFLRATNAGGGSGWRGTSVSNNPANLAPAQPAGLSGRRTGAGAVSLSWTAVTGADSYRVYFDFPDDDQGAAGWDWLPYRDVTVTVTDATAVVGGLPTAAADWGLRVTALNDAFAESLASAPITVANTS